MPKRTVLPPPPPLTESVMPNPGVLVHVSHAYHAIVAAFERATGITLTRWRVLYLLSRVPDCHQKYIVQVTRVDPGSITRVVKALEGDGLIERASDPADNRLTRVQLTAKGRRLVAAVLKRRKTFIARLTDGLAPGDLETLERLLGRIERNVAAG